MPRFSELDKKIRKSIMDPVLAGDRCPKLGGLAEEHSTSRDEVTQTLRNLEASICIALQNETHAGMDNFQEEELQEPLPELGEYSTRGLSPPLRITTRSP